MRNIFQNKKVLISIIVAVVVIVVAIVLFAILGKGNDNKKSDGNSSIKFSEEEKDGNRTLAGNDTNTSSNKTENKIENKISNNISSDVSVGSDVEDFHKEAAELFVEAFMDEESMNEFIEKYVDMKAYVAYEKVNGDESKFLDEYNSLSDDDPAIESAKEACLSVPESYNTMLGYIDMAIQMAKQSEEIANQTGESLNTTIDYESITDEDKKLVLKKIEDPEQSEDDENITKIKLICSWMQEDLEVNMVFYGDIVIFISDEEGTSLTESGLDQGSGFDE